ncbi:preprotein translocase subunit SecE [Tuberibacillus sp. Marseille-P3662]|uniref:preprotein translocase subunit SecE n=1 Tax=Tuberibacillus sp. Marseille-P3662 TaxID=1965358 RepID=UPI000A1CC8BB|nr:preprotein translocase subunit SecE [Tuberibacillus sp. Marseille-P3662]
MAGIVKKAGRFFQNAWIELKRVRWPNRRELTSYTVTVVLTVVFVSVFFALIDLGTSQVLELITE